MLREFPLDFLSLRDFPGLPEPVEDGESFAANARKKAVHFSSLTGLPVIADDSGLEVDALGGRPGVRSSRYASTDPERITRLLRELEEALADNPSSGRTARFACAVCLVWPGREQLESFGSVEGVILDEARGEGGFGYDPVFFYPPLQQTFAEIPAEIKNSISHRANALLELKKLLRKSLVFE